jgi:hypothetical protein
MNPIIRPAMRMLPTPVSHECSLKKVGLWLHNVLTTERTHWRDIVVMVETSPTKTQTL